MNLKREQEFVSQYHFDVRNFEWENNGTPEIRWIWKKLLQQPKENPK